MSGPGDDHDEQAASTPSADLSVMVTLLTTEHYNLQTRRAATIGEANGRASIFLGAVSAGLIAIGFHGTSSGRAPGTVLFDVLVLSCLSFLGGVTFLRCVELAIDDWQYYLGITALRQRYVTLAPELAELVASEAGAEQSATMLTPGRQVFQMTLTVAGSIGVITGVLAGADAGVLAYGLHAAFGPAVGVGAAVGLLVTVTCDRFQRARWSGAIRA